jgi:serine protease AprX
MRTLTTSFILLLGLIFLATSSVAQVKIDGSTGAASRVAADENGVDAHAGLTPSGVYVDPMVVEAFEVQLTQICILVLDPDLEKAAHEALQRLSIPFHSFDALHMVSVLLPKDQLDDVVGIPGLLTLYRNEKMGLYLAASADYTGAKVVWNTYGARGAATTIMIVDSGVDGNHPDTKLNENLIQNVKTTTTANGLIRAGNLENAAITDFDGHGTHVASIAGGTAKSPEERGKYLGIANQAKLVGFAAGIRDPATDEVSFESQTVLEAFNYALANQRKYNISVVSNSWGANGDFEKQSPINKATLSMYQKGMVVVFAAGNEGDQGEHTLNKYSVAPWVLAVAAGDYLNQVAKFSSRGTDPLVRGLPFDHPDVTAPGVGITAAKATADAAGGLTGAAVSSGGYTTKSGTSMATPHVSGIAAILLGKRPDLSPDDVMDILTATATPMPDTEIWDSGAGYVNALKAYQLALKATGHRAEFMAGKVKYAGPDSGDAAFARDPVSVGFGAGAAVQLASGDQSIDEFATGLVGTIQGIVFLVGATSLSVLAFGFGRGRRIEWR